MYLFSALKLVSRTFFFHSSFLSSSACFVCMLPWCLSHTHRYAMLGVANIYFGNLHRTAPDSYLKELGWARAMYDLALKADAGCAHAANGLGMVSRTVLHVHVYTCRGAQHT